MSDTTDDLEAYCFFDDEDDIEDRIERIERILVAVADESFAGTGGKYRHLWVDIKNMKKEQSSDE